MKLVIYGSRSRRPGPPRISQCVFARWGVLPSLVISGTAKGADQAGEEWARLMGIPCLRMPADWDIHGRRAGFVRNQAMAHITQAGLGFWDGESRGTAHMTRELARLGRSYHVEVMP